MSMRSASPSLSEVLDECASLAVGGGIITMTLFPFALPCIALVGALAVAAGLLGLAIGVIAAALAASLLLARRATRRIRRRDQLPPRSDNRGLGAPNHEDRAARKSRGPAAPGARATPPRASMPEW